MAIDKKASIFIFYRIAEQAWLNNKIVCKKLF